MPLKLLSSYLQHRVQYVHYGDTNSLKLTVKKGVPQGSVLGPLLFLIYINDLQNASLYNIQLFVDDTLLFLESKNIAKDQTHLNNELKNIDSGYSFGLAGLAWA